MRNKKGLRNVVIGIGILGLLVIGILILISYLRPEGQDDIDEVAQEVLTPEKEIFGAEVLSDLDPFDFSTQRVRVRVNEPKEFMSFTRYPVVEVFRSVAEFNTYYEQNKEVYRFQFSESRETLSFVDACTKYDEAYFENQILVLVILRETRGSGIGHNVVQAGFAGANQDKMVLDITSTLNGGNLDSPIWFLFIEPEAGVDVADKNDVTVFWDGENVTDPPILVEKKIDDVYISLEIPRGWNYGIVQKSVYSNEFYIVFWPGDRSEGKVKIGYYKKYNIIIESEDIHLGDYGSGRYVVQKENTDVWWSEYGDEAMQILSTVRLGRVTE